MKNKINMFFILKKLKTYLTLKCNIKLLLFLGQNYFTFFINVNIPLCIFNTHSI